MKKFNDIKERKGFSKIVVDDINFIYSVSMPKNGGVDLIVYDDEERKYEIRNIQDIGVPESEFGAWKGKHGDGAWGKKPIAWIIKNKIINKGDINLDITPEIQNILNQQKKYNDPSTRNNIKNMLRDLGADDGDMGYIDGLLDNE
jgi:hypothetical protein